MQRAFSIAASFVAVALICFLAAPVASGKPNILIIVGDDMGYGDIGVEGCTEIGRAHV